MVAESQFRVEVLGSAHKPLRDAFSSGSPELDQYLRTKARQDVDRRVAVVWVLIDTVEHVLAGYYTLNSYAVRVEALREDIARKLPRYPVVPVVLLGRLAVDQRYQGRGLGGMLLVNALKRAYHASRQIGAIGVVVHAKDDAARCFYERYSFNPFLDNPLHLVLPMGAIADL